MASMISQLNKISAAHGGGKAILTGKELGIRLRTEIKNAITNSDIPEDLKGQLLSSIVIRTYGEDNSMVEVGFWGQPIKPSIIDKTPAFMPSVYNFPNHYKDSPIMYNGYYKKWDKYISFDLSNVRGKGSNFMGRSMKSFISKYAWNNGIVDMKIVNG